MSLPVSLILQKAHNPEGSAQGGRLLTQCEDNSLAARFAVGERVAFERIVALHAQRVARLAHRLLGWPDDVDDVVQDVFLAAWRHRRKFRGDGGEHALAAWLNAITVNRCRTVRRRRLMRWARRKQLQTQSVEAPTPSADASAMDEETSAVVRDAVRRLPARDREVLVLHYLEQTPIGELGPMLGLSRGAVDVRLHRARKRLRQKLNGFLEDDS